MLFCIVVRGMCCVWLFYGLYVLVDVVVCIGGVVVCVGGCGCMCW